MLDITPSTETGQPTPANRCFGNPATRFQAGRSGNPRGRPKKDLDLAAMAQKHAQLAVDTLVKVMTDEKATPAARVSAAAEILDRGFGRAPASLDVNHTLTLGEQFEEFIREMNANKAAPLLAAGVVDAA